MPLRRVLLLALLVGILAFAFVRRIHQRQEAMKPVAVTAPAAKPAWNPRIPPNLLGGGITTDGEYWKHN